MKRPSNATPRFGMEELATIKRRHSMELIKRTDSSEECEVLIPQKEHQSKPASAIHLNVSGETDSNLCLASIACKFAFPRLQHCKHSSESRDCMAQWPCELQYALQVVQQLSRRHRQLHPTRHCYKSSQSGSE